MKLSPLPALCLALLACGEESDGPPGSPSVAGSWRGQGGSITVQMVISQDGAALSGVGSYDYTDGVSTGSISLSGTYDRPTVTVSMGGAATGPGAFPRSYVGSVADNGRTMTGRLSFGGSSALDLFTFTRQ